MIIATFGPTTAWNGKTITFENQQFGLEGLGQITAQNVADYDAAGHLTWAYDGLRQWVATTAAIERGAAAPPQADKNTDSRLRVEDAGEEEEATASQSQSTLAATRADEPSSGAHANSASARPLTPVMPDSRGRKVMRALTALAAVLAALATAEVVVGNTGSSSPAYADLVLDLSVAAVAALVAVAVFAVRLGRHPRTLTWLKLATCALLALAGGVYAAGAHMDIHRLSGMTGRIGISALAAWIALWTVAAALAVITVLMHDRESRVSTVSLGGVAWRARWPYWMWAPVAVLVVLGAAPPAAIVLFGTLSAYLLVWSARRCLPDDGTRLGWPGRGGPAVAGIVGMLLALPVLAGVVGQYGQIEAGLQQASTAGVGQGLVSAALEHQGQGGSEQASPLKTVTYLRHGIGFTYQTPTLKAVNIADVPVSLSQVGSVFVDPTSTDMLSSVAIVPTAIDPSGLVMVAVTSQPPVWLEQVQGMSKSHFAGGVLPQLADSIEQNLATQVAASPGGMTVTASSVTHRMVNGSPAVIVRLSGVVNGSTFAMEMRFLVTRENMYAVMHIRIGPPREAQDAALRAAVRSVAVKW